MQIIFSAILGWFSSLAGRFLIDTSLRFVAQKAILYTLLTVTLPVVFKNLLSWLFDLMTSILSANIDTGGIQPMSMQLTGLAGWIGEQMYFSTCLSIILAAICIRITLNFIPFVK